MKRLLNIFQRDQSGTVTVDWVVVCAAIVGLMVLILTIMKSGSGSLAQAITGFLTGWAF